MGLQTIVSKLYLDSSPKYGPKRKAKMIISIKGGTTSGRQVDFLKMTRVVPKF